MRPKLRRAVLAGLLPALLLLAGCSAPSAVPVTQTVLLLDGQPVQTGSGSAPVENTASVRITLDGSLLLALPFQEAHTLLIRQPDGAENTVRLTGDAVWMESATCQNQDCVQMGKITLDNLELRAMGGFIVCLPHRLTVEVCAP